MRDQAIDDRSAFLDNIMVAAPCTVAWDEMTGDDQVRFCNLCQLNVYNARELTKSELVDLLSKDGPRPCLRLYRRADGTIITDNCPVGLRKIRNGVRRAWRGVAAACGMVFSALFWSAQCADATTNQSVAGLNEIKSLRDDRVLKCLLRARVANNARHFRKAERYYKTAVACLPLAKHDAAFKLMVLSEYKALLVKMNKSAEAAAIQEQLAALEKEIAKDQPRDTNGFSCEPTILDERYMRTGRSDRTLALPGTLPPDAPIPDTK